MSSREIFGIVLRGFGLWLLYDGVAFAFSAFNVSVHGHDPQGYKPETYILTAIWESALGFYLLRGAPLLLNVAYPVPAEDVETTAKEVTESPSSEG